MPGFPFFRYPYSNYYSPYNRYPSPIQNPIIPEKEEKEKVVIDAEKEENRTRKISSKRNSFANINLSNLFSSDLEEPILEILGIKLYLDDIIILGLLFFLYKEEVQDETLFITLILLLLS